MPTKRFIIVCEGESEWTYLQRLQGFLDRQPLTDGAFETPLRFVSPARAVAKTGIFKTLQSHYRSTRKLNSKAAIEIWADFDLYHRNYKRCAEHYAAKSGGVPDFLFSFHNFEDFYALHFAGVALRDWLQFAGHARTRHFITPLHARDYLPEFALLFPDYAKGGLPADFVSWRSLKNLKTNLGHQPTSNPHGLKEIPSFAAFLIQQIELVYPGSLD